MTFFRLAFLVLSVFRIIPSFGVQSDTLATKSGLKYIRIKSGKGIKPVFGDKIYIHYSEISDGGKSITQNPENEPPQSFIFEPGVLLSGLEEGIALMREGDVTKFFLAPELAAANSNNEKSTAATLRIFEVELVAVKSKSPISPFEVSGKDTVKTFSGLKYIKVREGKGSQAYANHTVKVHYTGYFTDGTIFDSSVLKGEPFQFVLGTGQVIKGWDEGIRQMTEGDKFRLIIPPKLAYGSKGYANIIPPNTPLIFDVELLEVQ